MFGADLPPMSGAGLQQPQLNTINHQDSAAVPNVPLASTNIGNLANTNIGNQDSEAVPNVPSADTNIGNQAGIQPTQTDVNPANQRIVPNENKTNNNIAYNFPRIVNTNVCALAYKVDDLYSFIYVLD